jgi:hypothetical protein
MATKKPSSKDVMDHFKAKYKDKYGQDYRVSSYPKEMSLIKKKLLDVYGFEKSIQIVDLVVDKYEKWNPNKEYKLGVHSFTSTTWLQQKAVDELDNVKQQTSQRAEDTVRNKEKTKSALERILARKGGKQN